MKRTSRNLGLVLVLLSLAGCTVGPDYVRPVITTPQAFTQASPAAPTVAPAPAPAIDPAWWTVFEDPHLVRLVETAVEDNLDLALARTRVRQARALRRATASRGRPELGVGASGQVARLSENGAGGVAELAERGLLDVDQELYEAGFDAAWELDFFGKIRRAREGSSARLEAAVEGRRGVLLAVIAEVARTYVELRGGQRRLAVAEKNVGLQARTLELVEAKHRAGLVPGLDLERARAQLATTRAGVPPLRAAIRAAAFRLAVLTGRPPAALLGELLESAPLPARPELVPTGLPSELLRRRPDLRRAERQLHAATADVGVAVAELYPSFSLTGSAGVESVSFTDLFRSSSGVFAFGPRIRWPLFQGGRLRAAIDAAEAGRDGALLAYRQALLLALEDVEGALVAYAEAELARERLAEAVQASERSVELSRVLYRKGLTDFLTVLDAERTLTDVEDRLIAGETEVVSRVVALYKALGGGWEVFEPTV